MDFRLHSLVVGLRVVRWKCPPPTQQFTNRTSLDALLAPAKRRKRMPDVQGATQCTPGVCRIGQQSFDGFGHQMESKLTCIAAALALSLEFVHLPFVGKAHGEDPREMERFMDLGRLFRPLARPMRKVKRYPSSWSTWPFATPCRFCMNSANLSHTCDLTHFAPSWLRKTETNRSFRADVCCAERVYVADNCFDFMNCHADWPRLWYRARPAIQAHYHAVPKPLAAWTEGFQSPPREHGPNVVLHVRLGDVGERRLPPGYYSRAVRAVRAEFDGRAPPLFRLQTNGWPENLRTLFEHPDVAGGHVVVDHSKYSVERATGLGVSFHRMVTANVLVMGRSSLSMAAALLSNGTVYFPRCWDQHRRPLPHWRLLDCCADPHDVPRGGDCAGEAKWKRRKRNAQKIGNKRAQRRGAASRRTVIYRSL
jgi:hypothetical protein